LTFLGALPELCKRVAVARLLVQRAVLALHQNMNETTIENVRSALQDATASIEQHVDGSLIFVALQLS